MVQFRYGFVIVQLLIVCSAVYYALKHQDVSRTQLTLELEKGMETFHLHPSLFKRGCTIRRIRSKAVHSTLMMDAVAVDGFKLIYFDHSILTVSGCKISHLNFNIAKGAPTFEDSWLLPKKALGLKLRLEADVTKENILSAQLNRLYKRFWRTYILLCTIIAVIFHRMLLKTLFEHACGAFNATVKTVDYIMSGIENAADIVAACVYYYKALRGIIRVLKDTRQSGDGNTNRPDSEDNGDGNNNNNNNNKTDASKISRRGRTQNDNVTCNNNDGVLQKQPTQGIPYVPTKAEFTEANADPVTSYLPQVQQGQDNSTEADEDTRFTGPTEMLSHPSRPRPSRWSHGAPISINLDAICNRLVTDTPSHPVSTDVPNTTTDLQTGTNTSGEATASTSISDPAPATTTDAILVNQLTAISSTDVTPINQAAATSLSVSLPVGQPANQVNPSVQTTPTPATEAAPIAQPMIDSNQLSRAPSTATVNPTDSTGETANVLPASAREESTLLDVDASTSARPTKWASLIRRNQARKEIVTRAISSINNSSKGEETLFPEAKTPKGKAPEAEALEYKGPKSQSSKESSSKATFSLPGRIIKSLPPRARKLQETRAASTSLSSSQQADTLFQPSIGPLARLPTAAASGDRGSIPDFEVRKKRTKSAPVRSARSTPVASYIQGPTTEAVAPSTLSQNAVHDSHGAPTPVQSTFSLSINRPAVVNFYPPVVREMAGSISMISQEVAYAANAQLSQDSASSLGVQHHQTPQQVLIASDQLMIATDTQHTQQASSQYNLAAPPALGYYSQVQQQHLVDTGQYVQYATQPSNQTHATEDDGLAPDLKALMNNMFGDTRDAGDRNVYAPDSFYSTLPQQQLQQLEQLQQQQIHQEPPFDRQLTQDQLRKWQFYEQQYQQEELRQWQLCWEQQFQQEKQLYQQQLHQLQLHQQQLPQQQSLQHIVQDEQDQFTFSQQLINEDAIMENEPQQNNSQGMAQDTEHYAIVYSMDPPEANNMTLDMNPTIANPMPKADSHHTATEMDTTTADSSSYPATNEPFPPYHRLYRSAQVIEYTGYVNYNRRRWRLRPKAWISWPRNKKARRFRKKRILACRARPALIQYRQDNHNFKAILSCSDMTPENPSNAEAPTQVDASTHADEPTPPTSMEPSDLFINLGPRVISSPLTWVPPVENSESTFDRLLDGPELQTNPSMAQEASNYNFNADPPLPQSDFSSDNESSKLLLSVDPLDGHRRKCDFSGNFEDGISFNGSTIFGMTDQRQTDNDFNRPSLLLASRFSPPYQHPYQRQDLRLQNPFGNNGSFVDSAHVASDEMDGLVASAQQVSLDDGTISTPPFFPSPTRPLSPGIGPSKPVPPAANVETQPPGFHTTRFYLSANPPMGESSTQSKVYCDPNAPIRSAFDLRLHRPVNAFTRRKGRYVDKAGVEEKKKEEEERQVELEDS